MSSKIFVRYKKPSILTMRAITENINKALEKKDISRYKLSQMVNYDDSAINAMILSKRTFPEHIIKKLLPILEVSREEFDSWIVADKHSKEIIELAIKAKEETKVKRKQLILTIMIDNILEEKALSRTALAKQIQYSQSGLNRMIVGKIGLSKPVLEKISKALEVSQSEITGWILADSYNLDTLKMAFKHK